MVHVDDVYKSDRTCRTMNNNIQLVLLNAQSVKNKDIDIKEYLSEKKIDIAVITETWIQETDADNIWVEGCD